VKGMEDALVSFAQTGKLSFKSLADSILADILRMNIQANITGPLSQMMKGGLSGGSMPNFIGSIGNFMQGSQAAAPVSDAFIKTLPGFAVGTDYVPFDMVANIHKGERIVPAAQNNGRGSAPIIFNISTPDAASFRASQGQIAASMQMALSRGGRNL
jgi:hypothetical protein